MSKTARHFCALAPLPDTVPDQIEVMPVGDLRFALKDKRNRAGAKLRLRPEDAESVIAASFSHAAGNVLPIDFDHRSLSAQGTADSRAAGWITEMHVEGDRVMASVEWTAEGRRAIKSKSYRFISPVFTTLRSDGRVVLIEGAGLVNNPALPEIRQIASKDEHMEPIEQIAELLGLPADDTDQIAERIEALLETETHLASVTDAAGVSGDDAVTQVCSRLKAGAGADVDPAKYVPMSAFTDLQAQFASLQSEVGDGKAEVALQKARDDGKLTPAMEDWAKQLASKDLGEFQNWAASAPVVIAPSARKLAGRQPPVNTGALDKTERQVASLMGVDPEKFRATRDAELKED